MENEDKRDSFIIYRSFIDAIRELDAEQAKALILAIGDYALDCKEPNLTGIVKILWTTIKPQLIANRKRYENGCKGKSHGVKGGAPKGNQNARKQPQNNPKTTPNDNVNVNDNDNVNDNVNDSHKGRDEFTHPTLDEVRSYIEENGIIDVKADEFYNYYLSNGWMCGKSKMKDWRASIRTWQAREQKKTKIEHGTSSDKRDASPAFGYAGSK